MSFLIKSNELLGKCNAIWEKVKNSIKKEFDYEPVYNKKYLKAKRKSYNEKINKHFFNNKKPKKGSRCFDLSLVFTDSVFRTDSYNPQVFLEECKYVVKGKKDARVCYWQQRNFFWWFCWRNF